MSMHYVATNRGFIKAEGDGIAVTPNIRVASGYRQFEVADAMAKLAMLHKTLDLRYYCIVVPA